MTQQVWPRKLIFNCSHNLSRLVFINKFKRERDSEKENILDLFCKTNHLGGIKESIHLEMFNLFYLFTYSSPANNV